MKKIAFAILLLSCISGCSVPRSTQYSQLYSFTKEEKKVKRGLTKKKVLFLKDFRENDAFEEDIAALREEVEKYIASHAELSEQAKNNLRELKVAQGASKEEARLLLGRPDRLRKTGKADNQTEIWVYRINQPATFSVFIIPVLYMREGYHLYFKNNSLDIIERHYLQQTVHTHGPGIIQKKEEKKEEKN